MQFRREPVGLAEPEEERGHHSENKIPLSPVPEHVSAFDHACIVMVHGDSRAELLADIGSVAGMVEIAMSQYDKPEATGLAASVLQPCFKLGAPVGAPRIDQDIASVGLYQVAIYSAYPVRQ
jgi:hypothetical protein